MLGYKPVKLLSCIAPALTKVHLHCSSHKNYRIVVSISSLSQSYHLCSNAAMLHDCTICVISVEVWPMLKTFDVSERINAIYILFCTISAARKYLANCILNFVAICVLGLTFYWCSLFELLVLRCFFFLFQRLFRVVVKGSLSIDQTSSRETSSYPIHDYPPGAF